MSGEVNIYKVDSNNKDIFKFILDIIEYSTNRDFKKTEIDGKVYLTFTNPYEEKYFLDIIKKLNIKYHKIQQNVLLRDKKERKDDVKSPYPFNKKRNKKGLPSWL